MEKTDLTPEEEQFLRHFASQTEQGEKQQVEELFRSCSSPYQFAKTHSNYVKDWEKTKNQLENNMKRGILPPGASENLSREIIRVTDEIIQRKLALVKMLFESKFNETIFNYLGPDGKTKKFLGLF